MGKPISLDEFIETEIINIKLYNKWKEYNKMETPLKPISYKEFIELDTTSKEFIIEHKEFQKKLKEKKRIRKEKYGW